MGRWTLQDNELKDEDLINIVQSTEGPITFDKLDDVHEFILEFDIQDTKQTHTHVRANDIYGLYKKWRAQSKYVKTKNQFFERFGKFFKSTYTKGYRYYTLDPSPFDLTNEESKYNLEQAIKSKRKRDSNGEEIF